MKIRYAVLALLLSVPATLLATTNVDTNVDADKVAVVDSLDQQDINADDQLNLDEGASDAWRGRGGYWRGRGYWRGLGGLGWGGYYPYYNPYYFPFYGYGYGYGYGWY